MVAVNPYRFLPIYDEDTIMAYKNKHRDETKPHIYSIADLAYRNMLENMEDQSILVTGESGAGKTENTKKVIQYLAAIAGESGAVAQRRNQSRATNGSVSFEQQILQANPILEAFGNAQTVRNNNSSRFGKFIRIEFGKSGQIAGASIEWYLLEKSRVIHQSPKERNYHIFYQLLNGANKELLDSLLLSSNVNDYVYLKGSSKSINGVNDSEEFKSLLSAFKIMNISGPEQNNIFRIMSAILNLGNIEIGSESSEQARLLNPAQTERVCHLLGINHDQFVRGLLRPRVKAGREWVNQSRTADQVRNSINALSKSLYERCFGYIVDRVNKTLERNSDSTTFIGVLDIAGFEIFQHNSFEQLCINYTNEKLQQFFNHYMFVLEQEEYARENIEWKFIDFGHDLQPTIDLIEKSNPMGIFSCLDEDSVMPKATDKSFTDKLTQLWENKSSKFKPSRLSQGFTLTHYAADVEYSTEGWLEKNKDPLNDNVTGLLAESAESLIKQFFVNEVANDQSTHSTARVKKGLFRTVAQKHKEHLTNLMKQLNSTHPHFVRCIIPNHGKKPKQFDNLLVLDQLRCNGVLEGIRIARTGYPNRMPFAEFRQRYEVLASSMPKGYIEGQKACTLILKDLGLDTNLYKVGLTKVFFKSGVLAELEERRESMVRQLIVNFQSVSRGHLLRAKVKKQLYKSQATLVIKKNLEIYLKLKSNPWWNLQVGMRPLLVASRESGQTQIKSEELKKLQETIKSLEQEKTKLETDHRKTQSDLENVNKTLENERLLALDKEEIMKRAQAREAELEQQLEKTTADLDAVETQLDELLEAKHKVDKQVESWRAELEKGSALMQSLERDKKSLRQKIEELEKSLDSVSNDKSTWNDRESLLNDQISTLQESLKEKETEITDLKTKLKNSEDALEAQVKKITSQLEQTNKKVTSLSAENEDLREQINDLSSTSSDYEKLVSKKEEELKKLKSQLSSIETERDRIRSEKESLANKHSDITANLDKLQKEHSDLRDRHERTQKEAEDSRRLLEAKIEQDKEESKGRELLDKEVSKLRTQLKDIEQASATDKDKHIGELRAKQTQISNLEKSQRALQEEIDKLSKAEEERDDLLDQLEAEKRKSSRIPGMSSEIDQLRKKLDDVQKSSEETQTSLSQLERKLKNSSKEVEKLSNQLTAALSEKDNLVEQMSASKKTLRDTESEKDKLQMANSELSKTIEKLEKDLSNEKFSRKKLDDELSQKNKHMESLRAQITEEMGAKVARLSEEKRHLEKTEKELRESLEDVNAKYDEVRMQRDKLAQDVEDLNHDIAREQKAALAAERVKSSLEDQVSSLKDAANRQRMDRSESEVARRKLASSLEATKKELQERTDQLLALQKIVSPKSTGPMDWSAAGAETQKLVDLAGKLQESEKQRRKAEEARAILEAQLNDAKERWSKDLDEKDSKYYASKRAILDGLASVNSVSSVSSNKPKRPLSSSAFNSSTGSAGSPNLRRSAFESEGKENKSDSALNIQGKSYEEIQDMIGSMQTSKNDLLAVYHDTSKNLVKTKDLLAETQQEKTRLERELYSLQMSDESGSDKNSEVAELRARLEAEEIRNQDLAESIKLYKSRSEEYYSRIESAEAIVLKATRSETFYKGQLTEAQESLQTAMDECNKSEKTVMELQSRVHSLEGELEDKSMELAHSKEAMERYASEISYLRERQSKDTADSTSSLEALRMRYGQEIQSLSSDLEEERHRRSQLQQEVRRLEKAVQDKRSGAGDFDSTKRKELEKQIEELERTNEESQLAQRDSQRRVGSLLSQVRTLRTTMDEITVDRDQLQKDKRALEKRLSELAQQFEDFMSPQAQNGSSAGAHSANSDQVKALKADVTKYMDASNRAQQQMQKLQAQIEESRQAAESERKVNESLRQAQEAAEKEKKALHLKVIDLEARLVGVNNGDVDHFRQQISQLERQLSEQGRKHYEETRQFKSQDRSVRDLLQQLAQKDKLLQRLQDESSKSDSRIKKLTDSIDQIQASESSYRMAARRAEREARDAKERALRLEKELEDWMSRFDSIPRNRSFV